MPNVRPPSPRPIVLTTAEDLEAALSNLAKATHRPGQYEVLVRPVRERVTPSQRGVYRIWLRQIANHIGENQLKVHRDLAATFLTLPHAMPDGSEVIAGESTGDIDRQTMSDYLEWVRYFAITEIGLALDDKPTIPKVKPKTEIKPLNGQRDRSRVSS